jgi:iron complex transport system substrate-binding protein
VDRRAEEFVAELRQRLELVRLTCVGVERKRVVCLEWLDPPFSVGHWVMEMVELAGGIELIGRSHARSRQIEWDEVLAADPAVLLLIPCSVGLEQVKAEFSELRQRPGWPRLTAVRARQVFAAETLLFSQPGPRLVDGVELLGRLLHPDRFVAPLPVGQALRISADTGQLEPFR